MFEVNRKDRMVEIIHGEQKIEYPIEETENLVDFLPYKKEYTEQTLIDKMISFLNSPRILLWGCLIWLVGRLLIASIAQYGVYAALIFMDATYSADRLKEAEIAIYVLKNMDIIIPIYVVWDILSTIIKIYTNAVRMIKN